MAQTLEVPQVDTTAAPTANPDDLLSQLAGAELDKMLAEAEGEKPAAITPAPEATSAPQPLSEVAAAEPSGAPPAATEGSTEAAINAELDQLFKELGGDANAAPAASTEATFDAVPEPDPEPAPSAPEPAAQAPAPKASSVATTEQPTTAQEQAALKEILEADAHDESDEPASLPIYLKPLEWLSVPMQLVPEPARDLVGKVAIITFMNAISVIAYLLIFRR